MPNTRQIVVMVVIAAGAATICVLFGYELQRAFAIMAITSGTPLLFASFRKVQAIEQDGWRSLTPGAMEWVAFIGCGTFALFMAYVYNFIGSARSDAARQMIYLLGLIIAFGLICLYCGLKIAFEILRWNETEIQQRTALLKVRVLPWSQIASVGYSQGGQALRLTGKDGTQIDAPLHRDGIDSLLERLGIMTGD